MSAPAKSSSRSFERSALSRFALAFLAAAVALGAAEAQQPFASYDFESGGLEDFFLPTGVDLCGTPLPTGTAAIDGGDVVLSTDEAFGIGMFSLLPEIVEADFPASRDIKIRTRFTIDPAGAGGQVTQFECAIRARVGVDADALLVDSSLERAYYVSVVPEFVSPALLDGFVTISEFTSCHDDVEHPEWPLGDGFAIGVPGFRIVTDEAYWLEVAAVGNDDGGPVTISASIWLDGDDPPATPLLSVVDADGLDHTPETRRPETDLGVFYGLNFDLEPRPLGGTVRIHDISVAAIGSCEEAPATVTRTLWGDQVPAEGLQASRFTPDGEYEVTLAITDLRAEGACAAAAGTTVVERLPSGWEVSEVAAGGIFENGAITWNLDLGAAGPLTLTYKVVATGGDLATFSGEVSDSGGDRVFFIGGEAHGVNAAALAPISDLGTIQKWLILGPFGQPGGANPGETEIVRDYLTDGELTETTIAPVAGDTIEPDYNGEAASTALAANQRGRNPGDVPTWIAWQDLDDADDRIDFESVYGDVNDVMCYAVTYLDVAEDIAVNFAVSSDDAVHVRLDDETLHANAVARGALARGYQDFPSQFEGLSDVLLSAGRHTLVVKVFEGGGEHNFRLGFVDEFDLEIPGGPEGLTISIAPEAVERVEFRRGDANDDGVLNIADGIFVLNFLFSELVTAVPCDEASDANGDGRINIADGLTILNYLFVEGSDPPPAPGPETCGEDPAAVGVSECQYTSC